MSDRSNGPGRWLPWLVAGLAVVGAGLVLAGRALEGPAGAGWQDPFYSVFLAFTLDGSFLGEQSAITLVGAFAAALATYIALAGGIVALTRRSVLAWRAARRRGHVVVVGDASDAADLAGHLVREVPVVLAGPLEAPAGVLGVARPASAAALAAATGLDRARAVVLTLADERLNAALAVALAQRPGERRPVIWCRVGDRSVADRLSALATGPARIEVFDDADMMAREAFARHPAHAEAERMAADRVHILVVGFGRLGQAMAEEAVFSGLAEGLERPMVTVLDRDAARIEAQYRALRPALDLVADVAFIAADLAAMPGFIGAQSALSALVARDDVARVTAIALCLGDDADNTRVALALPELRRRCGRFQAPAFMRVRDRDAVGVVAEPDTPRIVDPNQGVIRLERAGRLMATAILDTDRRDRAAQALHEAWRGGGGPAGSAAADWGRLPETYRRANRRGADHISAKLFALGLVSERDPHAPATVEARAHAARIVPLLGADDATLDRLAALEQRRWRADRIIDGWVPAARRDDDLKHHPLLEVSDYAALPEIERRKDRAQIRTILGTLVAARGEGARPEIRIAFAGHRDLAPAEEARAFSALAATLAARHGDGSHVVTLVTPLAPGADIGLAEAAATALAGKAGELRLIVVEAVPYRVVLEVAAAEQGGDAAATVRAGLTQDGPIIVNSSRAVLYASPGEDFAAAARAAAQATRDALNAARG